MTKPYIGGISMQYFITDGSHFLEPLNDHSIEKIINEEANKLLIEKLLFWLAEESQHIWEDGDGYGSELKRLFKWTFENYGYEFDKPRFKSVNKYNRKSISNGTRRIVYERDGYECVTCKARKDLSIDHIIPVARGGTNDLDNLQTMCRSCNSRKGTK